MDFEKTNSGLTIEQIQAVELVLGVEFPRLYRELVLQYNCSYGEAVFPLSDSVSEGSIGVWLSLLPWDSESIWSCLACWNEQEINRKIIPFGEDGGGNWICFDYRESSTPSVKFWFHEVDGDEGLYPITSTFEQFIELIEENNER